MIWPFSKPALRVLMVCTANVCRSPAAEAYLAHRLRDLGLHKQVAVSSAGTQVGAPGRAPDPRVVSIAAETGVSFPRIRAKALSESVVFKSDYIWVMEQVHRESILDVFPQCEDRLAMLDPEGSEIEDPYFGSKAGVRAALEQIDAVISLRAKQLVQQIDAR